MNLMPGEIPIATEQREGEEGLQRVPLLGAPIKTTGGSRSTGQANLEKKLEEAALIVGRLAHDFGNLLTGVLGFAELALAQLADGSQPHRFVREIVQAAQKGAQLIQKLSLFSRRRPIGRPAAALEPVLAEEANRLRKKAGLPLDLRLDVPASLPFLALDGESVRQVLFQILENALEAVGSGGVVTVAARAVMLNEGEGHAYLGSPPPGEYVEVAVTDTGCGFPEDFPQRQATEVFFSTKPGHRGLGLAIVYGMLRAHHGGLLIEDCRLDNRGSIPQSSPIPDPQPSFRSRVRAVFPVAANSAPASVNRPAPQPALREMVLVVDDDPLTLEMVCTTLVRAGYRVASAVRGDAALTTYREAGPGAFRLVLSDVIMPAMSGFDLARRLTELDPKVKMLFITGQAQPPSAQKDLSLQQFDWLAKPFRPEGLLKAVRAALDSG
jgi:signal transduction histidine kinase